MVFASYVFGLYGIMYKGTDCKRKKIVFFHPYSHDTVRFVLPNVFVALEFRYSDILCLMYLVWSFI